MEFPLLVPPQEEAFVADLKRSRNAPLHERRVLFYYVLINGAH